MGERGGDGLGPGVEGWMVIAREERGQRMKGGGGRGGGLNQPASNIHSVWLHL